jgi:hypothetical protein
MYGALLLLTLITYHGAHAAAHDITLPFKLGVHTFNKQIEQEYKLHICHRLKKFNIKYPNHDIISLYKQLATTPLNQLIQQQNLLDKARAVYAPIQTCPNVTHQFKLALNQPKHAETPERWLPFRATARMHLRKFGAAELPPLDLTLNAELTQEQQNAYKTWLIVYFAIKQNEYMSQH